MRGTIFVLSLAASCFGAQASSIITLGGTPTATPSIIALGEPAPTVSDDKVAAIPKAPETSIPPMVIRGGIAGGVSADPSPQPVSREPAAVAAKPAPAATPQQAVAQTDMQPSSSTSESSASTGASPETASPGPIRKPQ